MRKLHGEMVTPDTSYNRELFADNEPLSFPQDAVPIDVLCSHIEKSTEFAAETEDYLSYATVLDLALGNPHRFTAEEANTVLSKLYKSLAAHPIILFKVGWDLPELLLKYIDRFFVSEVEALIAQRPFRVVMSLFSLLCEHGNPRELLVRACDLMLSTETELNSKRMQSMSLSEEGDEQQKQHQKLSESNPTNIDSANNGFDVLDDARQENVKFCTLFEVVRFSLQKIDTPKPSSFLLQAARTMLQVADDPNADILSVSTYARRMFLLARDFTIKNQEIVSPEETRRVRQILCSFLSHAADVVVRNYTLKWAERLYVQMRNKVALAPPNERDFVYTETEYTRRMSEVMSRFVQLMISYDVEPQDTTGLLIGLKMEDGVIVEFIKPQRFEVEGAESLGDNFWSRQILNGLSISGMALLATEQHFDGSREKKSIWTTVATFSLKIFSQCVKSKGTKDMLLYWALWISNYFESTMHEKTTNLELLSEWLHMLLGLIATSSSPEEQFVTGSIIARALRFQSPDYAYNFCIDIMKRSKSSDEHFVIVETLKMLITGKISNPELQSRSSLVSSQDCKKPEGLMRTQSSCVELNAARKKELTLAARDALHRLKNETRCLAWYYLNFLAVVPTDPTIMIEICDFLDRTASYCVQSDMISEKCLAQMNLVKDASIKLRQQAMDELQPR